MAVDAQSGPYEQFDTCTHTEISCKNRDENGKCIYETCVYDNKEVPGAVTLHKYKCMFCDEVEYRDPREMKIQLCDSCLKRALKAEKLPFTCVFCGEEQDHVSKIFLSGICDTCFSKLNDLIDWHSRLNKSAHCKNCGNG